MKHMKKLLTALSLITGLFFSSLASSAQQLKIDSNWVRDQEPFRIAGNLYYVGTYDLGCYLINTTKGLILINTGIPGSDTMIRRHIESLGFNFSDIKILLATHAHFDHVGAMAAIKQATGAKLMIHKRDAPLLADGGSSDVILGKYGVMFPPVKADRLLQDRDLIQLGDMQMMVLHHPGHTKGACSFLFSVKDEDREYRVLIANMPSILDETKFPGTPGYPTVGKDYAYTLNAMPKVQFDIWLASHASQFDLHKKRKNGDRYNPEAFFDQAGYDAAIAKLKKEYEKRAGIAK
ncbi:MAG TPA: subclass B3 metallo-beta-lactamase [Puia sp.]|nr:subclass B3 metallo-beta-lactamase [Puia sp.]